MTTKKLTTLALFIALSFVLSSVIILPNMAPMQHVMNIIGAAILGPWYNALSAFLSGGLRMVLSGRTFIATSGWIGALLSGFIYKYTKNKLFTAIAEVIGSGVISAVVYYFPMKYFFGLSLNNPLYYIPFFFPSAFIGGIIGFLALTSIEKLIFNGNMN